MPGSGITFRNLILVVMSGPEQGQRIALDRPILLGRDPRSRVQFDDERISRHHALIDLMDQKPVLRDLGSKNGTFVNGSEIRDFHTLRPNDRIRIGKTLLAVASLSSIPREPRAPEESSGTGIDTLDLESDEPISERGLPITRRMLRAASETVGRLAPLTRSMYPLYPLVGTIRKDFRADGAGVFLINPPLDSVYTEGDLVLGEEVQAKLVSRLNESLPKSALLLDSTGTVQDEVGTLIVFPLRAGDDCRHLFILVRDPSRPFQAEQRALAEALTECLCMLPMRDILQKTSLHAGNDSLGQIIGSSEDMTKVRELIQSYARANATVLLNGESGTGKELCARAIHQISDRRFSPYVEVNSACMLPELMESELFGHERGAFTGATDRTAGRLEIANGGTLFLDEIGELPLDLQAKLLRVLEGQPFYRVGGRELITVDVRFICATNRNLEEMVDAGTFRRDLFHRINILRLDIPPLREHLEDIPELVQYLVARIQEEVGAEHNFVLAPKAYRRLLGHHWPGNVRELRNVLQRMMLLSPVPVIDERMVPPEIGRKNESTTMKLPRLQVLTEMMEREEISKALLETEGQKSRAAKLLGISRPTLDKKIKFYGLGALVLRGKETLPGDISEDNSDEAEEPDDDPIS
ncbi:FHA domain-containing protein [bacterium]|nr:FHA domain-containing protein [bacterium]